MAKPKLKIGFLINTSGRVDDAKINQEIIRNLWEKTGLFGEIKIVHAFNGEPKWYPQKYLEDELVTLKNPGHFQGAAELIDAGMNVFLDRFDYLDYVIVVASDTWLIKPEYFYRVIETMRKKHLYLATCVWGTPEKNDLIEVGMAVDLFVLDLKWAKKFEMFPINYKGFQDKYWELLLYATGGVVSLEKLILARFIRAVYRELKRDVGLKYLAKTKIYRLEDREPVHYKVDENGLWQRTPYWPKMGLVTHHQPEPKKEILKKAKVTAGENIQKLLTAKDLSYFNHGTR